MSGALFASVLRVAPDHLTFTRAAKIRIAALVAIAIELVFVVLVTR